MKKVKLEFLKMYQCCIQKVFDANNTGFGAQTHDQKKYK